VSIQLEELEILPLERAETLPSTWYYSEEVFQLERRALFSCLWQYVGHVSRLPSPGSHILMEVAGEPVLIVRGKDGIVRGFYNVCRHRGGPLATEDGCSSMLQCKYHGWTYTLDGHLRGVPDFDRVELFDKKDFGLKGIRVEEWQGLLFAVLEEPLVPLDILTAGIADRLQQPLDALLFYRKEEFQIQCNWKTYMDNYLEGYHVPIVHPELLRLYDFRNYHTETREWYSFQHSPLSSDDRRYSKSGSTNEALYYALFPNAMLNILPGRLQTNLVLPDSPSTCRVIFEYYYEDTSSDAALARIEEDLQFSALVQAEDIEICQRVQRGLQSRAYNKGRLSVTRENAVYHFQSLIKRLFREYLSTRTVRDF
jgi:choline monooxygenase